MRSPIPWMGSKRRLAAQLLARMPEHVCYVELFAGSAALLFAREEPAKVEVINDIDGELANFFRVVKHHLVEFCTQFRWAITSRKVFEWLDATPAETLTDIQRAARFYYLQKLCFGGKVEGGGKRHFGYRPTSPSSLNLVRLEEGLSAVHERLNTVYVEQLAWQKCLAKYDRPGTLFFADPPYFETEGYSATPWLLSDYVELASVLALIRGRAMLTINDHPAMRETFRRFESSEMRVRYTVGGERPTNEARTELLFTTWKERS